MLLRLICCRFINNNNIIIIIPAGPLPPLRLAQLRGPHPAAKPLPPLEPLWCPLMLNALLPGEHELQAAEPGSISALPP